MRLVLWHGFTQTGASWQPIAEQLRARGHVVACPDLPGHGGQGDVEAGLADGGRTLIEATGRAIHLGYSMGGRMLLHGALARPDLVEGLVLVSTTAGIEDADERRQRVEADERLAGMLEREGVDAFLQYWLAQPLFAGLPVDRAALDARRMNTVRGLASSLRRAGTGRMEPLWDRLTELTMPRLVIAGGRDTKFAALAHRLDRGATIVEGAGHALPWEAPAPFVEMVCAWLDANRGAIGVNSTR